MGGGREADGADRRRSASRDLVIRVLRELGTASRAEIGRRTALSRATVSSVVNELQEQGLVVESPEPSERSRPAQTGRPPSLLGLHRSAGVAVGIDFGKRHLRVAVADLAHRILAEEAVHIETDPAERGIETAVSLVNRVLDVANIERSSIVGVGMGLPGPVHQLSGEVGSGTILPGWVGVRAQEAMTQRLGHPVRVDNDANLGALAEWMWGAARGCDHVAYFKLSTGIGAGLIAAGRPFHGAGGTAGEIGHTMLDPRGPVCRCGNRGCLETFVGAPALLELLRPALGQLTLREAIARAAAGDAACRRVFADAGDAMGVAAAGLCNLFNPQRIGVGGELAAAGDLLLEPLRAGVERATIRSAADDVEVVAGLLGERAEVLGAIALVLRDTELATGAANREAVVA